MHDLVELLERQPELLGAVLQIRALEDQRVRRLRQLLECFIPCHLASVDEVAAVSDPFVDSELARSTNPWKNLVYVDIVVFTSVVAPSEVDQGRLCLRFVVRNGVQDRHRTNSPDDVDVRQIPKTEVRVRRQRSMAEPPVDILDVLPVRMAVRPVRVRESFGGEVHARDDEWDIPFSRRSPHQREDRVIRRDLPVRSACPKKCQLKIPDLIPVDHMGDEVDVEAGQQARHVVNRQFGVPSVVEVHRQSSKAHLDQQHRNVRAIRAARDADDAVVRRTLRSCPNLLHRQP